MAGEIMLTCYLCGTADDSVITYEGFGIELKLHEGSCDGTYLALVETCKDDAATEIQIYKDSLPYVD